MADFNKTIEHLIKNWRIQDYTSALYNIMLDWSTGISFLKKYDELHKKLKKILHKDQDSHLLLDINEFEYPKANETLRKIHKQLWQEYYDCLKNMYSTITSEKVIRPIALEVLEGLLVTLKCEICISPMELYTSDSTEWHFNNSISNETLIYIEESDNIRTSSDKKSLTISNIKSDQAGQYWCKLGNMFSTFYYISVDTNSQDVKVVHPNTAPNMPHAASNKIIPKYNLIIHTTWTKWSPCSKCNIVSKKIRHGYCTISLHENNENLQNYKRQILENETNETVDTTTESKIISKNVISKIKMILQIFRNKLPCKSKYLPEEVLNIPEIKNRKTEVMIRYCKIKCLQNEIFEIRDKQGNVLESANNSGGIYSMLQGIPIPPPPVIRTIIYQKYSKEAIITCPGNVYTNVPIIWKKDNKTLNPSVIEYQTRGRIYINPQMYLIFKSLKFQDANIYSCWQKDEIVGVVKLNVVGETELQINQSAIMIGGILIIAVFLIVFLRAFQGRKRFTIH